MKQTNTYKKWATSVDGYKTSLEVIQRLAFGFGYSWPVQKNDVVLDSWVKYLVFNPNNKEIRWAESRDCTETDLIVFTFEQVLELFKNPPLGKKPPLVIDDGKINFNIEVGNETGDVIVGYHLITSKLFDRIVKERNALIGVEEPKKKLPKVSFEYNSISTGMRVRNVLVLSWDGKTLEGLDVDDENKFKKFLFERMITKPVLVGFE